MGAFRDSIDQYMGTIKDLERSLHPIKDYDPLYNGVLEAFHMKAASGPQIPG